MNVSVFVLQVFSLFIELASWAIIIRVLISWFKAPHDYGVIARFFYDTTEPILRLARAIVPRLGPVDVSPIVALLGLMLIRWLVFKLVAGNIAVVEMFQL